MSNYTKQISWSGKDALSDSDPEKVISGGDFDTEFSAVQTAINSKIDGGTITNFTSTGIDDNATSTAITIDASENVGIGVVPYTGRVAGNAALDIKHFGELSGDGDGARYGFNLAMNAYNTGGADPGNWKVKSASVYGSTLLQQRDGTFNFYSKAGASAADSAISWTTAMTINNSGSVTIGATQGSLFLTNNEATGDIQLTRAEHSSFAGQIQNLRSVRSGSSGFYFLLAQSNNSGDNEFIFRGDGQAYADGSWNGGGADYAEYFEWADGNALNEDRRGISVVLDGDKIRPAVEGESPIGVISARPAVVGDNDMDKWKQKHLRSDFGDYILEEYTVTEWEAEEANEDGELSIVTKSFESDRIPADETVPSDAVVSTTDDNGNVFKRRTLNPDWNPDTDYVSREDRKEWDTVGLMGKLRVLKGQPVDARWIKMRDVSDTVEEWLVR